MIQALAVGGGLGLVNGLLSRISLGWAIRRSDAVFYGVWAAGFFYRLLFSVAVIIVLVRHPVLPWLPVVLALVAGQFLPQLAPVEAPAAAELPRSQD